MSVIPEGLVLVREIRFMRHGDCGRSAAHLGGASARALLYPDATNLLAYVVRALPRTPR